MDAKRALEATNGDMEAATQWLRVQGLASAAKRADREAGEGAVAVVRDGNVAAIVELRCETDFVAKSEEFVTLADEIAARVAAEGDQSIAHFKENIDTMLTTLKENISIGRVYRLEAGAGRGRRHLHPPPVGSRRERRRGRREGRQRRGRPRDRACTLPSPSPQYLSARRRARKRGRRGAQDRRGDHAQRGQARSGDAQDHRGPTERLVQGPRALARAAATSRTRSRRWRSS